MITEEKWRGMKVAEKCDWLYGQVTELGKSIATLTMALQPMAKRFMEKRDAPSDQTDKMLTKIDHLERVMMIMHGNLTSRLECVEAMLGVVEQ